MKRPTHPPSAARVTFFPSYAISSFSWRWIMILEGIPTFIAGVVTLFFLADSPENASYLTQPEKDFLKERRLREQGETENAQQFHWADVRKAVLDWRVIAFAAAQFGVDTMVSLGLFAPPFGFGLGTDLTGESFLILASFMDSAPFCPLSSKKSGTGAAPQCKW